MENNENNFTKKEKIEIAIIVFLVIVIIVLLILNFISEKDNKEQSNDQSKTEEKIKDITNSQVTLDLEKSLVSSDHFKGLYYSKKITINDINNLELISFNLIKYKEDNNLSYASNVSYVDENGNEVGYLLLTVNKTDFNSYMQKNYNTTNTYNINSIDIKNITTSSNLGQCVTLLADDNNYEFVSIGASCGNEYVANKIVKAEQDGDNIYIYDKAVSCTDEIGGWCNKTVDDGATESAILDCTSDVTEGTNKCSFGTDAKSMANYVLENLSDKLNTFKHTFKKSNDGKYYWVSSEISN